MVAGIELDSCRGYKALPREGASALEFAQMQHGLKLDAETVGKHSFVMATFILGHVEQNCSEAKHTSTSDESHVQGHTSRGQATQAAAHLNACIWPRYLWLHLMHASIGLQSVAQRSINPVRQKDDRCLFQAVYSQLLGDQLCICVLVLLHFQLCIQVHKVYSCMQGDMEGVRQQAEQHLAAAHAEARSTIQKAQATAADLQVTNFAHLCRVVRIDSCVCVCLCLCWHYAKLAVAVVCHIRFLYAFCYPFFDLASCLCFIWLFGLAESKSACVT